MSHVSFIIASNSCFFLVCCCCFVLSCWVYLLLFAVILISPLLLMTLNIFPNALMGREREPNEDPLALCLTCSPSDLGVSSCISPPNVFTHCYASKRLLLVRNLNRIFSLFSLSPVNLDISYSPNSSWFFCEFCQSWGTSLDTALLSLGSL